MNHELHKLLPPLESAEPDKVDEFLSVAARRIADATGAEDCSVFLADGHDRIVLRASTLGSVKKVDYQIHYRTGEGLTGWVWKNEKPVRIGSIDTLSKEANSTKAKYPGVRWADSPQHLLKSRQIQSMLAAPIRGSRAPKPFVCGVVRVVRLGGDPEFTNRELAIVERSANELGQVLQDAGVVFPLSAESTEVYRSPLVRIELVKRINADVMAYLSKNPNELHNLHHRLFEELVAELLIRDGWKVDLSLATCDGGYDVLAVRSVSGVGIQLLVQAKKYRPDRPVGVSAIRELYAVKQMNHATKAMLATTSYVSKAAKTEFRDVIPWELEFREFQDLTAWLKGHAK